MQPPQEQIMPNNKLIILKRWKCSISNPFLFTTHATLSNKKIEYEHWCIYSVIHATNFKSINNNLHILQKCKEWMKVFHGQLTWTADNQCRQLLNWYEFD